MSTPRERVLQMRDEELARMMRRGQLPRIAAINAVIAALDEEPTEWDSADRAVVSDDGTVIRLALYREDGKADSVELSPAAAVALAGRLLEAALPRLNGE